MRHDRYFVGPRAWVLWIDVYENVNPGLLPFVQHDLENHLFVSAVLNLNVYEPTVLGLTPGAGGRVNPRLPDSRIGTGKILPRRCGLIRYDEFLTIVTRGWSHDSDGEIPRLKRGYRPPFRGPLSQSVAVRAYSHLNGSPTNFATNIPLQLSGFPGN